MVMNWFVVDGSMSRVKGKESTQVYTHRTRFQMTSVLVLELGRGMLHERRSCIVIDVR
jgi:hypothetical protein